MGLVHQNARWDLMLAILCHFESTQESRLNLKYKMNVNILYLMVRLINTSKKQSRCLLTCCHHRFS